MAKMKRKHSDFYYRLNLVNDKLHVYTSLFYNKVPCYQEKWEQKKVQKLKNQIKEHELKFLEDMKLLDLKIKGKKGGCGKKHDHAEDDYDEEHV